LSAPAIAAGPAVRHKWFTDNLIEKGSVQSAALRQNITLRAAWARRFDPIRLTLEHATFYDEHVGRKVKERKANDVLSPDRARARTPLEIRPGSLTTSATSAVFSSAAASRRWC
jgi:hypothetical protein